MTMLSEEKGQTTTPKSMHRSAQISAATLSQTVPPKWMGKVSYRPKTEDWCNQFLQGHSESCTFMLSETTMTPIIVLTEYIYYIALISTVFELEVLPKRSSHSNNFPSFTKHDIMELKNVSTGNQKNMGFPHKCIASSL